MYNILAIAILLAAIALVLWRLPKIDLGHSEAFKRRRVLNWVPLGLTYAFLYMGRYNLKVSQHALEEMPNAAGQPLMGSADFATIFGIGTVVYGFAFLVNGPLTDKIGGRRAILVSAIGAAVANAAIGAIAWSLTSRGPMHAELSASFVPIASVLYAINMYFQSFGAAAIVKGNAPWFHVRERGVIGAVFGILISLGIYFAFDWGALILEHLGLTAIFVTPALILAVCSAVVVALVKDTPGQAGHADFDTADASSGDDGPPLGAIEVFKRMLTNPIILTIAFVEFCSGFLRQAIMQWFQTFAKHTNETLHLKASFVYQNWGLLLCVAGILGGTVAGLISDHLVQSRRGPVAAILYGAMLIGAILLTFTFLTPAVGWIVVVMSMAIIGVHGMLSGTASMDFGGKKNVGVAVGIIDGFVYAGTACMSLVYGIFLPDEQLDAQGHLVGPSTDPSNWLAWPVAMIPMALIGLVLATRLWNAKPKPKVAPAAEPKSF
ncbi:MAG: MFS transporter [Sandaracinaceae bacterium]|nr:MFS transporter [Sandaracinaceae bacterium]